jgi:hypothetical protein
MPSKGVQKLTREEKSKGRQERDRAMEKSINLKGINKVN